jgi:apolipoprotein N-acyltransferase
MKLLRRHRALLLAVAGGIVFALTAPPTDLYPAVIVGLALLAASIADGDDRSGLPASAWPDPPTFFRAFGRGAAWGTAAGLVGLRFVPAVIQRFTSLGAPVAYLALVLLAAGQSIVWALGAGVTALLRRHARVPFEIAFGAGILVALSLPAIFVWSPAGLVSPWPAFVQLADVVGEHGVSVLFAVGAALLARAVYGLVARSRWGAREPPKPPGEWPRAWKPALAAAALFAALPLHGALRIASITRESAALPTVSVGLVDQAMDPRERWDSTKVPGILRSLRALTRQIEAKGAELTVWPEAAYPYELGHDERTAPTGRRSILGSDVRGPILFGLITEDRPIHLGSGGFERNSYNSATVVTPDGALQPPYDKLELLWFGETVPGGAAFPWLRRVFQRSGGLLPGVTPRALDVPAGVALHTAVLNCYEDTLTALGRRLAVELAPNLLVNVTNDAWFHDTAEPELHARLGAMRAVELRLDLVRAVNLGVTSWIDAAGVVRARYAEATPGTLLVTPTIRAPSPTLYARFGDAPAWLLLGLVAATSAWRTRRAAAVKPPAG